MAVQIDPGRCPQNHLCPAVRACPVGALSQKGWGAPEVDPEQCIYCQKCIRVCPMGALKEATGI